MKTLSCVLFIILCCSFFQHAQAQSIAGKFTSASLQASGLTCSMCSKAVKEALEEVIFVENVQVDIKNQQYKLRFNDTATVDFDALAKAVEDAGFGIASLKLAVSFENRVIRKDDHLKIGSNFFHVLNGKGQTVNGATEILLVDKAFISVKDFRKYSAATAKECVNTGKATGSCAPPAEKGVTRVYHIIL